MDESISLQEIAKIVRKRLILIIILIVISVGISAGISFYVLTPIYQAQSQILVNQKSDPEGAYIWNSTEADLKLINTYNVIITSPVILTPVIEKLKLDVTPEQLSKKISVSNQSGSKVVNISVLDPDPLQAVEISNVVAEVFENQIPKLMSVNNISILSEAKMSDNPSPVQPNKMLNMVISTVIGLMIGVGLAILLEILDTTVKSEKDIEEILGLPVIGVVGLIVEEKKNRFPRIPRRARRNKHVKAEP